MTDYYCQSPKLIKYTYYGGDFKPCNNVARIKIEAHFTDDLSLRTNYYCEECFEKNKERLKESDIDYFVVSSLLD